MKEQQKQVQDANRRVCRTCHWWQGQPGDVSAQCHHKSKRWGVDYADGTHVSHWSTGRECRCKEWKERGGEGDKERERGTYQ